RPSKPGSRICLSRPRRPNPVMRISSGTCSAVRWMPASRYLRSRLQLAHLPFVKNFDQFDFGFQPSIDERQIRELRTLRFIHEASNVVFLGPPGVGKTHLSVALAEAAIQAGFGAYFMTAHDLVTDLARAYREGRLARRR